jgi:hypothetical protein
MKGGETMDEYLKQPAPMSETAGTIANRAMREKRLTRQRFLELAMIAEELVTWLRAKGVQPDESCLIRDLAGQMWNLE